ncbi:MAG: hypothetical protein HY039_09570 [Nitrospirae bacterium]|nr:hypothetical protein [Nitrospirota bacterium]
MRPFPGKRTRTMLMCAGFLAALAAWPSSTHAQTVGAPANPLGFNKIGVGGQFEFDRRDVHDTSGHYRLETSRLAVKGMYGVDQGIDLYVKLGAADAAVSGRSFNGDFGASLGVGSKIQVMSFQAIPALKVNADVQVNYLQSKDGSKELAGWDMAAAGIASYTHGQIVPYGGIRLSYVNLDGSGGMTNLRLDDNIGLVAGIDIRIQPQLDLNIEGRLIDTTGLTIGVTYRF